MVRIAISQSNYIPWKGYFDLIASVDTFVTYDCVQYTRRDWRNRNLIKSPNGLQWLTIPVRTKGSYFQSIESIEVASPGWAADHWLQLERCYKKAHCFRETSPWISHLFDTVSKTQNLSQINRWLLEQIAQYLGITTKFQSSSEFDLAEGRSERLLGICKSLGATTYVSGPSARSYLDVALFAAQGIAVEWFDYSGYPEYPQQWGTFSHGVTVLDLILNCGSDAPSFLRRPQQL